jgi:hypothetical protein
MRALQQNAMFPVLDESGSAGNEMFHGNDYTKKYIGRTYSGCWAWASSGAGRAVRDANRRCTEQGLWRSSGISRQSCQGNSRGGNFQSRVRRRAPKQGGHIQWQPVNAFVLVNGMGERHPVRDLLAPEKLVHLAAAEAAERAPDYLIDELPARIERGAVTFHLKAQLASPGDSTKDASTPGPIVMRSWNSAF